jgi:hypothetical protein
MDTHTDPESGPVTEVGRSERALSLQTAGQSLPREREDDEHAVATRSELYPFIREKGSSQKAEVLVQNPLIGGGAQLPQELRRALHVGETAGDLDPICLH